MLTRAIAIYVVYDPPKVSIWKNRVCGPSCGTERIVVESNVVNAKGMRAAVDCDVRRTEAAIGRLGLNGETADSPSGSTGRDHRDEGRGLAAAFVHIVNQHCVSDALADKIDRGRNRKRLSPSVTTAGRGARAGRYDHSCTAGSLRNCARNVALGARGCSDGLGFRRCTEKSAQKKCD